MSYAELVTEINLSDFAVEPMTEHDLLEVVEIEQTCGLSLWGWDAYMAELERREAIMMVARRHALGLRNDGDLHGFVVARLNVDELHVNNIGVRDSARRRGVGSVLLAHALEEAVRRGAQKAFLEVRAKNGAAQALYRRYGFVATGRRKNYYKDPTDDALVMCAELKS